MRWLAICNRELRRVPVGWQHPGDGPLLPEEMPSVEGLAEDEIALMAYETTTEGSPISPAFPNTPEGKLALVAYCAEHASTFAGMKADGEAWAAILFGEGVATVTPEGQVEIS